MPGCAGCPAKAEAELARDVRPVGQEPAQVAAWSTVSTACRAFANCGLATVMSARLPERPQVTCTMVLSSPSIRSVGGSSLISSTYV